MGARPLHRVLEQTESEAAHPALPVQVPKTTATTGPHDYFNYGQKTAPLIKFYREEWKASVPSESSITEDASQGSVRIKVASTAGTDAQGKPFYSAGTQIRLTQQRTLSDGTVVRGNTDANEYWLQGLTARPESETILQQGVPVMERHQIKVSPRPNPHPHPHPHPHPDPDPDPHCSGGQGFERDQGGGRGLQ